MGQKQLRQRQLLAIISKKHISTQGDLVDELLKAGFHSTQASISRDIRELGLVKRDGRYSKLNDNGQYFPVPTNIVDFIQNVELVGTNLVVVKTNPATAHSVSLLLEQAGWNELAGTIAGDDTVFVAVYDSHGTRLVERIDELRQTNR